MYVVCDSVAASLGRRVALFVGRPGDRLTRVRLRLSWHSATCWVRIDWCGFDVFVDEPVGEVLRPESHNLKGVGYYL